MNFFSLEDIKSAADEYMGYAKDALMSAEKLAEGNNEADAMDQVSFGTLNTLKALLASHGVNMVCSGSMGDWLDMFLEMDEEGVFDIDEIPDEFGVSSEEIPKLQSFMEKADIYIGKKIAKYESL